MSFEDHLSVITIFIMRSFNYNFLKGLFTNSVIEFLGISALPLEVTSYVNDPKQPLGSLGWIIGYINRGHSNIDQFHPKSFFFNRIFVWAWSRINASLLTRKANLWGRGHSNIDQFRPKSFFYRIFVWVWSRINASHLAQKANFVKGGTV